jgi:hypothetical protein
VKRVSFVTIRLSFAGHIDSLFPRLPSPIPLIFRQDILQSSTALKMALSSQNGNSAKTPESTGKRKRVETVDLTGDDSNDTVSPVSANKRPHNSQYQAPTPSTGRNRSSFSSSGMPMLVSGSQQHTEAERQACLMRMKTMLMKLSARPNLRPPMALTNWSTMVTLMPGLSVSASTVGLLVKARSS